jgi:tRNA-splicing ligase RtcB
MVDELNEGICIMDVVKFDKPFNVIYDKDGFQKVPMKLWLSEVEQGALDQLERVASLPFAFHHVGGMPDMHQGYGMPIGGVLATKGYIIPNAVGVDIGCGMCAIRTNLTETTTSILKKIMGDIRKLIPVGFKHNKKVQDGMPQWTHTDFYNTICNREYDKARKQLGTLGGGNHFIEIQKGDDGYIWVMIHSGSRNLGKQVADHYNKLAVEQNEKWFSRIPKSWELAFLPFDDDDGRRYYREMQYCCDFALANRNLMIQRVQEAFENHTIATFYNKDMVNIHHNFAAMENHFGKNVLVHRKGATRAYEGELGIIPGSQGTKSYIVEGKGCTESFKSCSHGAGRTMSRKKARTELNLADEQKRLDDQGIVHGIRNKKDLEEASSAYKDIDAVMNHQQSLVSIRTELTPLAVVKG